MLNNIKISKLIFKTEKYGKWRLYIETIERGLGFHNLNLESRNFALGILICNNFLSQNQERINFILPCQNLFMAQLDNFHFSPGKPLATLGFVERNSCEHWHQSTSENIQQQRKKTHSCFLLTWIIYYCSKFTINV